MGRTDTHTLAEWPLGAKGICGCANHNVPTLDTQTSAGNAQPARQQPNRFSERDTITTYKLSPFNVRVQPQAGV